MKKPKDDNLRDFTQASDDEKGNYKASIQLLKKLNKSIVLNYNELLQLLVQHPTAKLQETYETSLYEKPPTDYEEQFAWQLKAQQLNLLFLNMTFVINALRPHQAKEQLITIAENQLEKRKKAIERLEQCIQQCKQVLQDAQQKLGTTTTSKLEQVDEDVEMKDAATPNHGSKSKKRTLDSLYDNNHQPMDKKAKLDTAIERIDLPSEILNHVQNM